MTSQCIKPLIKESKLLNMKYIQTDQVQIICPASSVPAEKYKLAIILRAHHHLCLRKIYTMWHLL